MSDGEIILSSYKNVPVVTAFIDNKMEFLAFERKSDLQNIYLGKVDHIVKNLNAAFIKYDKDEIGYLPLGKIVPACVCNKNYTQGNTIKNGDEVIVQVEAEAIKLKKAKLTTSLSISGKYSVVTLGRKGVGASVKLNDDIRHFLIESIRDEFNRLSDSYSDKLYGDSIGVIIRTNASSIPKEAIVSELLLDIESCINKLIKILDEGRMRTIYSLLHSSETQTLDKAKAFLNSRDIHDPKVIEDSGIHGIISRIDSLRQNKIWLKSGAFLIIEQLESFNAIDVNTGKAIKGKDDITEKVNFEAADEIMRQVRLRNLTGMILIDFINMSDDKNEKLIAHMKNLCRKDPVHTNFIDITGLGIMELTRNKNDKSLKEILSEVEKVVDSLNS
ncbi:ribonuclease E/G [Butyrivibrio sp. YAB3001]|uniref:ribonuclease E/G n=1 Tax=Butyrivibrio sp. YAB3001 TaxID=1520812 RepID=UPI0008F61ED9|nr:ribonuclease E/G [Butyrivibrio sp. YAB3001]SFB67438.1 ribonuclease G [Butyrivibrio sp. YAB3001]